MPEIKIYRCFHDYGDGEIWAKYDGNQIHTLLEHNFARGEKVHKYQERQFNAIKTILWDAKGIYMNVQNVKFPRGFDYESNPSKYKINKKDKISKNGLVYKLFREIEMGRGWGIFMEKENEKTKMINQNHLSNIQDYLIDSYIKGLGINFERTFIAKDISSFDPKIINFK